MQEDYEFQASLDYIGDPTKPEGDRGSGEVRKGALLNKLGHTRTE